ncbi:MAG: insulinase family protein [Clostridia bacterium]|nr:insulinase family protein [Clostridia bacterium]
MTVQQLRIAENIRLSHIRTDRFKTGVLTLTLTLPLTKEHLAMGQILPAVLRRGTERFPTMASIHKRLDELYASVIEIRCNRSGHNLSLSFSAEILDDAYVPEPMDLLDGVLDMLAQLLLHPNTKEEAFDESVVKQEIRFACDAIRSEINNTRSFAMIRLMEMMRREDPCSPTMEELELILKQTSGASLYRFYQEFLTSSPMEIFYVGSLSEDVLRKKILAHFHGFGGTSTHALCLPTAEPSVGFLSKTEAMPVAQGKLAMGFRTGVSAMDERVHAMILFNELLGGSPSSKLFLQVRERMSLCYYCSSAYHKNSGILTVSAGIDSKNREKAEKAILAQLDAIRQGSISDGEWHAARTSLENIYRQIYDNPFELQNFYGNRILFGKEETVEDSRQKLLSVQKQDVIALAKEIVYDSVFFIEGTQNIADEEDDDDE